MPKHYTFPTLFDDLIQLNISDLKKFGYLKKSLLVNTTINWSVNGKQTASMSLSLNTLSDDPFIFLSYQCDKQPFDYYVYLESNISNLGKGSIWYFICPQTGNRCRKLYLHKGIFVHREAIAGAMYERQTKTKEWRYIEKVFGAYFNEDKCYREIESKHFKKYYKGKPTKRYLKLLEVIEKAKTVSHSDIEMAMMVGVKGRY